MDWLQLAEYWHWWVLGVVLVILEVFSPGVFFLWLGIAAGLVGLVMFAYPELPLAGQLLTFALFSVVSILLWRAYLKRHPIKTDQPLLNRRGEQYVGRVFTLDAPVVNGAGKIRVDDSIWKIHGTDCPAGTRVRVTGVDGVVLKVDPEPQS
jgi:membrane protein implicated in regulation of membrane protease activity